MIVPCNAPTTIHRRRHVARQSACALAAEKLSVNTIRRGKTVSCYTVEVPNPAPLKLVGPPFTLGFNTGNG